MPGRTERVWDAPVRWFHWINVLCILFMAATGTMILNDNALGMTSEGKVLLKEAHSCGGYVFVINLAWRLIWAFIGNRYARWPALLPGGSRYIAAVRAQLSQLRAGQFASHPGHSPLGRVMVTALLILMLAQGLTGLVLAGTDVYLPPFGRFFAGWVTGDDPTLLAMLQPGSTEHVIESAYTSMREFRGPIRETHEILFFALMLAIAFHVTANVLAEVRGSPGQISAMFSGRKTMRD